ncbi:MAG: shikimate dehydrogenase family protein [Limisphaerales bacterium]
MEPLALRIDAATRYCAVLGCPVRHSASPAMQNAALAALGLNWRYLALEVRPEDLAAALTGAKAMGLIGLNLTVPHKLPALEMMDVLDESAREWGAVNTVRFEGREAGGPWRPLGEWTGTPLEVRAHGFNTDAGAMARALQEELGLSLAGASILLFGAGGAGRTAALKLASEGAARLFLVNRTRSKAEALAREIQARYPKVQAALGYPSGAVELVLNATSLGLKPGEPSPLDEREFCLRRTAAVYDMIYRPAETDLLRSARAAGCRAANGLGMLLCQGAMALELWTGRAAPAAIMRQALEESVYGARRAGY